MLNLGETFPDATVETSIGTIELHNYFGDSWGVVFSHPKDFTPVCTTELARMAQLQKDFTARDVKTVCISVDSAADHKEWVKDISSYSGCKVPFPIIADPEGAFAQSVGMLDKDAENTLTVRACFILSPDKKVRAIICYPASTGRNFDEILRVIDALQLSAKRPDLVTPVDWKVGDEVLVKPDCETPPNARIVSLPSGKEYIRFTKAE